MPDITVTLRTPDGINIPDNEIPGDYTAEQVISEMVDQLNLPWVDPDNNNINYYLEWIDQGMKLQPGRSLIDLGIKNGDTIALQANGVVPKTDDMVNPLNPPMDNPGQVTVNLNVLDVNKVDQLTFNTSHTVSEILNQVISGYNLLTFNPKLKQAYTYKVGSKALGRYLHSSETLSSADVPSGDTLTVYREEVAGGANLNDARNARLQKEYTDLMNLSRRGSRMGGLIKIEPVNYKDGCPVEEYIITFKCKGIIGIKDNLTPIYGNFHQVKLTLGTEFPVSEPFLRWLTPIWHPNIEHLEPHHVCTDKTVSWWPGRNLKDLVITLGEIVQYKQYHAAWKAPYPLDREVAKWVEEYAEPNGILSKGNPVDTRPLLPRQRVRSKPRNPVKKIKFGGSKKSPSPEKLVSPANEPVSRPVSPSPLQFGKRTSNN
jgi:ubiquitin-protein ligase